MNKIVVIYESKYGYTKRYAEWTAKALSCPIFERKRFRTQDFSKYDIIVYGGGLYAGSVSGIKLIADSWRILSKKKVFLFTCGLADTNHPDNVSNIKKSLSKVLSPEMLSHIELFHLRGGIDYSNLNFIHKSMMYMLRRMLLKKGLNNLSAEERYIIDTYGSCMDFTDSKSIQPLTAKVLAASCNETQ